MLEKACEPKTEEVTEDWRKLRSEELCDLFSSLNTTGGGKVKEVEWAGHVAETVEKKSACRIMMRKTEGKKPFERAGNRWKDNIKEIGWEGVDWIHVAQDREK